VVESIVCKERRSYVGIRGVSSRVSFFCPREYHSSRSMIQIFNQSIGDEAKLSENVMYPRYLEPCLAPKSPTFPMTYFAKTASAQRF
jgi:hypothetical protein